MGFERQYDKDWLQGFWLEQLGEWSEIQGHKDDCVVGDSKKLTSDVLSRTGVCVLYKLGNGHLQYPKRKIALLFSYAGVKHKKEFK